MGADRAGRSLDRRSALALGAGGLALLAGCSGDPTKPSRPPKVAGQPWLGGTLRVAQVGDVGTADGHLNAGYDSFWLAYDRLISYDQQMRPRPMLAESWEVLDGGKRIILHLRRDVRFHSGRPFTSADVRYNFNRVREPKLGAGSLARQAAWFEVETPDPYTVVLTSDRPRPSAFDLFEYLNMVDRETMEGPYAKSRVIGTGPYKLADWNPGVEIRLVRNQDYWDKTRPYLDEIVIGISPDPLSLVAQLESGAVDVINRVQARDLLRLMRSNDYRALTNQKSPIYAMTVNTTLAPFDRREVRQALSHAVDRDRFVRTILCGITDAQILPWPKGSIAYDPVREASDGFDLDKARFLLRKAGIDQLDLEMIWISSYGDLKGLAEIYQGDLAKIGINARLRPLEANLWRSEQQSQSYKGLNLTFVGPTHLHPQTMLELRNYSPKSNAAGFKSERYTQLAAAMSKATDEEQQRRVARELNDFYLDECFVIPVSGHPTSAVMRSNVHGLAYTMHEALSFTDTWIEAA